MGVGGGLTIAREWQAVPPVTRQRTLSQSSCAPHFHFPYPLPLALPVFLIPVPHPPLTLPPSQRPWAGLPAGPMDAGR